MNAWQMFKTMFGNEKCSINVTNYNRGCHVIDTTTIMVVVVMIMTTFKDNCLPLLMFKAFSF